mgnify:CR=1 FL=1
MFLKGRPRETQPEHHTQGDCTVHFDVQERRPRHRGETKEHGTECGET